MVDSKSPVGSCRWWLDVAEFWGRQAEGVERNARFWAERGMVELAMDLSRRADEVYRDAAECTAMAFIAAGLPTRRIAA